MSQLNVDSNHAQIPTADSFLLGLMSNCYSPTRFDHSFPFEENIDFWFGTGNALPHTHNYNYNVQNPFLKKVEDEMKELGGTIKHHEVNIQYLKALANKLDSQIAECNIALGNLSTTNAAPPSEDDAENEDVVVNNILKYQNTGAALFCRMKYKSGMSEHSLIKDVVGVVSMLATTDDPRLSSVLSEFLGLETMLSVVCKTSQGFEALESYNDDGSINKTSGIHAFAADVMGISLDDRFQVIILDNLRSYPGDFIENDPHRRLDLVKPVSLNGEAPPGFIGFAVNMVSIDNSYMYCMSKAGNTLRETLFYNLFSTLQVYKTRKDMLKAQPFISNGAVSLDGGIMRRKGFVFAGHQKRGVDVKFPVRSRGSFHTEDYYETENKLKETEWKKRRNLEDLQREQALLDSVKYSFELKKTEFVGVLANATQVGRASTPR